MRRITIGLAVALCAFCAFAASAFAKETPDFGEFVTSIAGQTISESNPGHLRINKEEGSLDITGLQLAAEPFGPLEEVPLEKEGKVVEKEGHVVYHVIQDTEHPCEKVSLGGLVKKERSSSFTFELKFQKCIYVVGAWGSKVEAEQRPTSFTLAVTLESNRSAEVGAGEKSLVIKPGVVKINGLPKCPIEIPEQSVPLKSNVAKEYEEIAEFSDESFEPSNWEKSKKLKELYPSGEKDTLDVEFGEKFKHLVSYTTQGGRCVSGLPEENPKIVKEGEYKGMIEHATGHLYGEIEDIEVKNGDVTFVEP